MNYKTPGVYIEEISKFPPSVAQVETAIPVFIGFTEKAKKQSDDDLYMEPTRITSLLEYEEHFGKANNETNIQVTIKDEVDTDGTLLSREMKADFNSSPSTRHYMYYAMQMYFANGGGPCYIIALNNYAGNASNSGLYTDALAKAAKVDEITLFVFPDAIKQTPTNYKTIIDAALQQCADLQDRFVIMDAVDYLVTGNVFNDMTDIRNTLVGNDNLKYGAAYYPYLNTVLPYTYQDAGVNIVHTAASGTLPQDYSGTLDALNNAPTITFNIISLTKADVDAMVTAVTADPTATHDYDFDGDSTDETFNLHYDSSTKILTMEFADATRKVVIAVRNYDASSSSDYDAGLTLVADLNPKYNNTLYNAIKQEIQKLTVRMAPSSTMAGIYASVDSSRGVWKSPANVSVRYVKGPDVTVSSAEQQGMNVDTSGKSVNAIRAFTGKGTLVWGARTLAGNDNEWRYISVRRFFNMVEESIKKATERFVFESNDAVTWLQVKVMIENFLTLQWRAGALQGVKPEHAFYVKVGLGETMTADDILNGRMIVEMGMAVVRPAEFIILRFSHKLAES